MPEWVTNLLKLQEQHLQIARIQKQLAGFPEAKNDAQSECRRAEAALAAARQTTMTVEKDARSFEAQAEAIRTKKRDFQSKSALIKNNDEYRAAMVQIEQCDKAIADLEDQQLAKIMELEEAKKVVAQRDAELKIAQQRTKKLLDDIDQQAAEIEAKAKALQETLPELSAAVEPDVLKEYTRLRSAKNMAAIRPVLVPVDNGACGNCRMKLSPQYMNYVRSGKVVCCSSCQLLLYYAE